MPLKLRGRMSWRQWRKHRRAEKHQKTFIWCPSCGFELVMGGEWLGQEVDTMFEGYRCNGCGAESVWDFDTYPCPVRVKRPDDRRREGAGVLD